MPGFLMIPCTSSRPGWLLLVLGVLATSGCGPAEPKAAAGSPPVVLITFEGLRADAVGALAEDGEAAATPNLDRLAGEADWAGRGVAASSWAGAGGASLLTGLEPWKHQLLTPEPGRLAPELNSVSAALEDLGYRTAAYLSGPWIAAPLGFRQGFDSIRPLRRGRGAREHLRSLRGEAELVWIHLQHPSPPWLRRDWLLPPGQAAELPEQLALPARKAFQDPEAPPPGAEREICRALYRNNVAWADVQLGRFLEALRASGHWDETLLAVTSTHGQGLGEEGQIGDGTGLGRELLEVPLILKLPRAPQRRLAPSPDQRVATVRLWATLVEAAGGRPPPGVAPSLFHDAGGGILSELYGVGDSNLFSWLEGDRQLLWRTRFAAPGADRERAFQSTPPLSGRPGTVPQLELRRWRPGGWEPVEDGEETARMSERLRWHWLRFLTEEVPPGQAAEGLSLR